MTANFEKPKLTGATTAENVAILETWAAKLVDDLNYYMNHIDEENMTKENKHVSS